MQETNAFPEVDDFINEIEVTYNLTLHRFPAHSYQNLSTLIEKHNLKAIIIGTRKDDPNGFN